jgi:hypothetical protein
MAEVIKKCLVGHFTQRNTLITAKSDLGCKQRKEHET